MNSKEIITNKQCLDCQEIKPRTEFSKRTYSKDGLQGRCKICARTLDRSRHAANPEKEQARKRAWYAANSEKERARQRERYASNPEKARARNRVRRAANPEKERARSRAWHDANPEKVRAQRAANSEKERARSRAWRAANPEKSRLGSHHRRARKKANGIFLVTPKEIRRMLTKTCYLCNIALSTEIEHIIPISRGGRHSIGNLLGACGACNSRKGSKLLMEYRLRTPRGE